MTNGMLEREVFIFSRAGFTTWWMARLSCPEQAVAEVSTLLLNFDEYLPILKNQLLK
jgi:hypothetical protein